MATILITLESVCSGGNHLDVGIATDGGEKKIRHLTVPNISEPLDDTELDALFVSILRLSLAGKTLIEGQEKMVSGIAISV